MVLSLIGFELRRRLKQLSTYVYAAVLFAAGLFLMLASGGVFRGLAVATGNERVLANSSHSLYGTTSVIALLGLFTVAAVFGQAVHQDFGHDTWMLVFTKNVRKLPYLAGRFLGALCFAAVLFLSIGLGQLAGSAVVYLVHPEQVGPTHPLWYLWPYLVQVWPMLYFTGALFFSLAALTRRMAPVYVGVVVLVLGYLLTTTLLQDVQNQTLAAMLDPFGFGTFDIATRYWTPAERNRDLVPLWGLVGANRLLWSAVGTALLFVAVARFRTTVDEHAGRAQLHDERSSDATPYPTLAPRASQGGWVATAVTQARLYFSEIARSPVYWVFLLCGLAFLGLVLAASKEIFGTATLPVTYRVLELAQSSFRLFSLILIVFYAGELVWRERDVRANDIVDATRAPLWVAFVAKLLALLAVALSVEAVVAVASVVAQLAGGITLIEWRQYAFELLVIDFGSAALFCALAVTVHVALNHKYLSHTALVAYFVAQFVFRFLGVEERLLRYGAEPRLTYSDMNGYGHFLPPVFWHRLYWSGWAGLLLIGAYLLVVRGRETSWRARLAQARARAGLVPRLGALAFLLVLAGAGGFVFWNTHLANPYRTKKQVQREQADYEKTYQAWASRPQPRIVAADVRFDIFPSQQRLEAGGIYTLSNKSAEPVTQVMLNLPDDAVVRRLTVAGQAASAQSVPAKGLFFFDLATPLLPGEQADLSFELSFFPRGFRHGEPRHDVVANGTFFNNFNLPVVGYLEREELTEDNERRDYGLAPKERMAPRDDPAQLQHNYIRQDSDFISFSATVSTEPGQVAVAPGYVEREWVENGRPHWRYVMDQPILNFFSVLSARYQVRRDEWSGVKLEIYYHPTHTWNLDAMMQGMKDALSYCSESFGPYQHRQARILEFPRYEMFAQSFPNTIPYSEAVGFTARVRPDADDDLDYPYYVTAHEIAHQWWAHQVVGANVRGATMTSETLAQYSALMVMKHRYGPTKMRRFLKFELDRYLMGRVTERKKELPLAQNENQAYIHYQKGSLAMYALQDFIGEDRVNRALRRYVEQVRFSGPPYTTSAQLLSFLGEQTPDEYRYLLNDLFETITLYDNRTLEATATPQGDGGYLVTLKVKAQKLRSDEKGDQTELDFDDWMDIGALDDKGNALYLAKQRVKKGESLLTFTVAAKPAKVGIDPLNMLIDRNSDDNVKAPTFEQEPRKP